MNSQRAELAYYEPTILSPDKEPSLDVIKVWYTIQGEGPFVGKPAVFIRLAGCNLVCPACDTAYTLGRHWRRISLIMNDVWKLKRDGLVVITGGEPFRQPIGPLCEQLVDGGWAVQIETNGVLFQPQVPYEDITIVCSPKTPKLHPDMLDHIYALKYILDIQHIDPEDGLPSSTLGRDNYAVARPWPDFKGEIFVAPLDEDNEVRNALNLQAAARSCLEYGYRLSIQTHKLLGLE